MRSVPFPARLLTVAGFLLCSSAAQPQAAVAQQDARALVSRASAAYRGLQSLRADFDQLIQNPMIGDQPSKGTLIQSGQAQLAMRFSEPEGEAIVIDGEYTDLRFLDPAGVVVGLRAKFTRGHKVGVESGFIVRT